MNNCLKYSNPWESSLGSWQASGIFFDEEITQQIKELKDDAGAMSKYQIIEAAKILRKEEFDRIEEWVKILGSASMKTVALVKLKMANIEPFWCKTLMWKNRSNRI